MSEKNVYSIGSDWYIAESPAQVEELWVKHNGCTHEEMTGEPMPKPELCNPAGFFRFQTEKDSVSPALLSGRFEISKLGRYDLSVHGLFGDFARVLPVGFFASTEY